MTLSSTCLELRAALNPDLATAAFMRAGGHSGRLLVERVHFSTKRPPVIRYRLEGGDGSSPIMAEMVDNAPDHAQAECIRLAKRRRRQTRKNAPAMVIADSATNLVFRPPGLDASLPGLRWLARPELALSALVENGLARSPEDLTIGLRAHRLGKRAVLQIDFRDGGRRARYFARLRGTTSSAGRKAYLRHCAIATAIEDHPRLSVPAPLAFLEEEGIALVSAMAGDPLSFEREVAPAALVETLRAVVDFQALQGLALPVHSQAGEVALLSFAIERFISVFDGLADPAVAALALLRQEFAQLAPLGLRPCHRDLHEDQLLLAPGRVTILDFDTATLADPMLDFGNLLAHIRLAELREGRPEASFEPMVRDVMGAAFDAHRLDLWRRAALLRLVAVHGFATGGEELARRLLLEAAG